MDQGKESNRKRVRDSNHPETMFPLQLWLQDNNVPHRTFYHWLHKGIAPRVTRIGRRVYIQAVDDAAWRESLRSSQDAIPA